MRIRLQSIVWTLAVLLILPIISQAKPLPQWPQDVSDLKADPSVTFGVLNNGVRYAVMPNTQPEKRVDMHLVVESGSFQERENQRGLAHFMEHIAFCGSTHFKPGELIKHFQRLGMNFGADANAHTGFDETVYDVRLPDDKEQSLRDGLRILRDYAGEALILQSEVARERGVILSEKTARDSQSYRNLKSELNFYFPGSIIPDRLPIGEEKVIKAADAKLLRDYYDTWYRPERMAVVVVGDVQAKEAVRLVDEYFSDLKSRAPERQDKKLPRVDSYGHDGLQTYFAVNPESAVSKVSISVLSDAPDAVDNSAQRREDVLHQLALLMFNERLAALSEKEGGKLLRGDSMRYDFLNAYTMTGINGECEPGQWKACLGLLEQQLRSSLKWGFTPAELQRAKKRYLAALDSAVQTQKARTSQQLSQELMQAVTSDEVFLSPEQERDLQKPMAEQADISAVQDAWKAAWNTGHRLLSLESPKPLDGKYNPEFALAMAWAESAAVNVPRPKLKTAKQLALPAVGEPGKIAKRTDEKNPDMSSIEFANGIRLNIMRTEFEKGKTNINLVFGNGRRGQAENQQGLARLAIETANESGMLGLSQQELEDALAGRTLGFELAAEPGRFIESGFSLSGEEEYLLRLMRASLYNVTWSETAFAKAKTELVKAAASQDKTVDGLFQARAFRFFSGGNNRLGRSAPEAFAPYTLDTVRDWLTPYLTNAPLEIDIVGDVDTEAVIQSVAKVFGTLPQRNYTPKDQGSAVFPAGKELQLKADSEIEQAVVSVSFPSSGYANQRERLGMRLVAEVFGERMRKVIREKLGLTYSPWAGAMPLASYPGYGLLLTHISSTPDKTDLIAREVRDLTAQFIKEGITKDELERARKPAVNALIEARQSNAYWMDTVLTGLSRYPQQVQWSRDENKIMQDLTVEELDQMVQNYLQPDKAATLIITSGK
ncbi:MAG: M16 family metallopeptidase [Desulfovibrio sp.]|uniref:M16 family metallopeptidase n=1 Tax=Desulfovibrio sp. 7SRBS1 TaxID=3378064 RepID=UPI003B3FD6D1